LIKALEDGAGSGQEYRELIRELYALEMALLEVKQLSVDDSLRFHKTAAEQVCFRCSK
jgi:hypothetical protein